MSTNTRLTIKSMSPQLMVSDINCSIEFYTTLGFDVIFRYEDFYASIVKDGCSIHLKSGKPSVEGRKSRRTNQDLDIMFSVEAIENLYQEISSRPVEIVQPLRPMPYGTEFYIADPDGYIIGFLEV